LRYEFEEQREESERESPLLKGGGTREYEQDTMIYVLPRDGGLLPAHGTHQILFINHTKTNNSKESIKLND